MKLLRAKYSIAFRSIYQEVSLATIESLITWHTGKKVMYYRIRYDHKRLLREDSLNDTTNMAPHKDANPSIVIENMQFLTYLQYIMQFF